MAELIRATGGETEDAYLDRLTRNVLSGAQSFDDLRFIFDAGRPPGQPYGAALDNDNAVISQGYDAVRTRIRQLIINRTTAVGLSPPWQPDAPVADEFDEGGFAFLSRILESYGLSELTGWAREQLVAGHSPDWIDRKSVV